MVGFGITVPVLPFLARELGAGPIEVSLLVSLFALAQFVSGPVWGSLSDRFGRKKLLVAGLLGYSLSFFLSGLSRTVVALVMSRTLGGLLSASIFPSSQALIADLTDLRARGPAMAAMGAWINLGFLFGPALGGLLSPLGYEFTLFSAGAVVVATAAIAAACLPDAGAAALTGRAEAGSRDAGPGPELVPGRASAWPRLSDLIRVARSPIAPYLSLTFAVSLTGSGLTALLVYFVIDRFGGTPSDAGLIFATIGLTGALVQGFLTGRLITGLGERRVVLAGALATTAGLLALVPAASLGPVIAATVLIGLGMSTTRPALTSAVSCLTPLPQGLTMGVQSSLDSLGRTTGPVLCGWVYGFGLTLPFWMSAATMVVFTAVAGRWSAPRREVDAPPTRPAPGSNGALLRR